MTIGGMYTTSTSTETRLIAVIGASSGTGAITARLAAQAHATVRAVSRSGGNSAAGLTHIAADAARPAALRPVIEGTDAVIVMVGAPGRDRSGIRARVTRTVVDAMHEAGVRRLIVQSSLGVGSSAHRVGTLTKRIVFPLLLAPALADHTAQERIAVNSDLDWTVMRPGYLTDRPLAGRLVAVQSEDRRPLRPRVNRTDLAGWAVGAVDDPALFRRRVVLGTTRDTQR